MTWWAAKAYCEASGGRLPTEAEWEFAARGGLDGAEFPWGDEPPDPKRANWSGTGIDAPTRVGRFPPNRYGIYDLAGNVWEFVEDPWTDDYSTLPASPLPQERHVIRGGSFGGGPINLRVRYRDSHPAAGAGPHVGFRCVRSVRGFFSFLKRGLVGTFHHVRAHHLHRYMSEFDFRCNLRSVTDGERAALVAKAAERKRLTLRQPIWGR